MGIFSKLFGSSELEILAPVEGQAVAISEVSDPTFGEEILGKGIAVKPTGNLVVAPCDGSLDQVFDTGHAFTMTADSGAEVLVHVGLDTVTLNGEHFTIKTTAGQKVKAGTPIIEFDREAIAAKGFDTITPVVICNSDDFATFNTYVGKAVKAGDKVIGLKK